MNNSYCYIILMFLCSVPSDVSWLPTSIRLRSGIPTRDVLQSLSGNHIEHTAIFGADLSMGLPILSIKKGVN